MAFNSLYSCFALAAGSDIATWNPFNHGIGYPIAGDPSLIMTRAHTNIPRSADVGIPMGWDAVIRTWRASANMRFADGPIADWAAGTTVELFFNERTYSSTPLLDLLAAPQPLFEDRGLRDVLADSDLAHDRVGLALAANPNPPMWIRENIAYGALVTSQQKEANAARLWLVENIPTGRFLCWIHLDGMIMTRTRT